MKDIRKIKQDVNELFRLRKQLRFQYTELAKFFNVNRRTLSRWENEESIPNEVYLPMIKKFVELSKAKKFL